jgi:hypothetical protein
MPDAYEMTLEDLRVAHTLCTLMRRAQDQPDNWAVTAKQIQEIGRGIDSDGGHSRMIAIATYLKQYAQPRRLDLGGLLDMTWNGIGLWGSGHGNGAGIRLPQDLRASLDHQAITNPAAT